MVKLAVFPVGEPRVVYLGPPAESPPERSPIQIVLVRPNETPSSALYSGKFRVNLGVLTLATHLEENGIRFGVIEGSLFQCSRRTTAELATECRPRFVGIAVYSTFILAECLETASLVKELQPDVQIVLGGHGASFVPREILENHPAIDAVISGEGHHSLLRLLRTRDRTQWAGIPNLSFRRNGSVQVNAIAPVEPDLDRRPLPHRFAQQIMETEPVLSRAPLMAVSSVGCYDRCSFCTVNTFSSGWRGRSPMHVVDELDDLFRRFKTRSIHFWDDTFTGSGKTGRQRAIAIADEIKSRGLEIMFHITARPGDLTEEVVAALASAGLKSVFIGVESSQQTVLDNLFGKHATADQATEVIDLLWRYGVHRICIGFMLFHSQMTWETFSKDLDLLDSLPTMEIERLMSRTCVYPGSKLWSQERDNLPADSYMRVCLSPLPSEEFESLYRVCANIYNQTSDVEMLFVCLEERYLDDIGVVDFLAGCRVRLFRFMSARARAAAGLIEIGSDFQDGVREMYREVFVESMRIVQAMRDRLGDDYFDLLLAANRLQGFERFLDPPSSGIQAASPGGGGLHLAANE